jgi:hypothetical protein
MNTQDGTGIPTKRQIQDGETNSTFKTEFSQDRTQVSVSVYIHDDNDKKDKRGTT